VASGLVDRPSVAHERLAAHLVLAFTIFAVCMWTAADLLPQPQRGAGRPGVRSPRPTAHRLHGWLVAFGVVFGLQVIYGAFVAGLDAGLAFNTYPLMAGSWWPPAAWRLEPAIRNLIDNVATVQWIHRTLPVLLLLMAIGLVVAGVRRTGDADRVSDVRFGAALLLAVLVQAGLGIATLLSFVPTGLAALHQAVALILFGIWLSWLHLVTVRRATAGASMYASSHALPHVAPHAPPR